MDNAGLVTAEAFPGGLRCMTCDDEITEAYVAVPSGMADVDELICVGCALTPIC